MILPKTGNRIHTRHAQGKWAANLRRENIDLWEKNSALCNAVSVLSAEIDDLRDKLAVDKQEENQMTRDDLCYSLRGDVPNYTIPDPNIVTAAIVRLSDCLLAGHPDTPRVGTVPEMLDAAVEEITKLRETLAATVDVLEQTRAKSENRGKNEATL